jgi:hypothetical protein
LFIFVWPSFATSNSKVSASRTAAL